MTDLFKEREKGEELKFGLDQQHIFLVRARRTKLFGHWLAENFGKTGDAVDVYVNGLVHADIDPENAHSLIDKIQKDLSLHNMAMTETEVILKLEEFERISEKQVTDELH